MDYAIASVLTHAFEYDTQGKMIYHGTAKAGSGKSKDQSIWRIYKNTFDATGNLTDIQWANGNTEFDNKWDDRLSLDYL